MIKLKVKEYISNKLSEFKNLYGDKDYILLLGKSIPIFLILIFLIMIGYVILEFILSKFEAIFLTCTICLTVYKLSEMYSKTKSQEKLGISLAYNEKKIENEKQINENNFIIIRKVLVDILSECYQNLGVKKPSNISEVNSEEKIIIKDKITIYRFNITKTGNMDCDLFKEFLQYYINKKVFEYEIDGITQKNFIYQGKAYPILQIESIKDKRNYYEINIVWACEQYFDLVATREKILINQLQDYKDEDF